MTHKWLLACALAFGGAAFAQTPWPAVQSENYPTVAGMGLVRHEQSILLGEADQQTGLFYAQLGQGYSERVQTQLIADARRKGWKLQSAMRIGTQYLLAFVKGGRLLDIRLTNNTEGVEAVYSVALNQQAPASVATTMPSPPVFVVPNSR